MKTAWKGLGGAFVAFLMCAGAGQVHAQQPGSASDEIQVLRQRLDAQEAELQTLRGHVQAGVAPATGANENIAARLTALETAVNLDAAPAEPKPTKLEGDKAAVTKPTFKINGRLFADHMMITQNAANKTQFGDLSNRSRFDTARIDVAGLVNEIVDYKLQFDFQSDVAFKDVWMTVMQLPALGNVRMGHFKEPFSLDELTSSRFITFMERSSAGIFTPARRYGIMAFNDVNQNQYLTWFAGGFREGSDENSPDHVSDDGYSATSRLVWLPYYDEPTAGRYLLHLGVAGSYRVPNADTISLSRDPGVNISGATFNSTGTLLNIEDYELLGVEAAWVWGAFSMQSEYYTAHLNRNAGVADADLNSFYVYASYFLTGENRGYNLASKSFDRVTPFENFFRVKTADGVCHGKGAWEVAVRYSYVDLLDGSVNGSRTDDVTFGVNWYLNPYTRLMFNYVRADVNNRQGAVVDGGNADLLGMRFQIDF